MIIKVTQEHIDKGKRQSRGWCPIACALRDVFGKDCDPRVDHVHIALGASTYYQTPSEADDFICAFDRGSSLAKPFKFELKPKSKYND